MSSRPLPGFTIRRRSSSNQEQAYGRIMAIMTPLFLLTVATGLMTFQLVHLQPVQAMNTTRPGSALVSFPSALADIDHYAYVQPLDPNQHLNLSIGLRPQHQDELASELQHSTVHLPTSARYWPSTAIFTRIEQTLTTAGLKSTGSYDHHLFLTFSGSARQVASFFHVTLNLYRDEQTDTSTSPFFYANKNAPLIPAWMAQTIVSINGLNNIAHWQRARYYSSTVAPQLTDISSTTDTHTTVCPKADASDMTPTQIASVYHTESFYQEHIQGEGQSIALFEIGDIHISTLIQALESYTSCFGQSRTRVNITSDSTSVNNKGQPSQQQYDESANETLLDAELVLGLLPRLQTLHIYTTDDDENSYLTQWARIIQDVPSVVSTSWGQCETGATPQVIEQENVLFQIAALQRQTIVAATGDGSQKGCPGASNNTQVGLDDPSTQPFVTSVGGTTLMTRMIKGQQQYRGEAAWNLTSVATYGTNANGGMSGFWKAPAWQRMFGINTNQSRGQQPCQSQKQPYNMPDSGLHCRQIPDIALNAAPSHGYLLYCTSLTFCSTKKPWVIVGGTAAVAPMWAAFLAQTNQFAHTTGQASIGFLNPRLYAIANDPVLYSQAFHDVIIGQTESGDGPQDYPATVGYDMATGLGSPNMWILAKVLLTPTK